MWPGAIPAVLLAIFPKTASEPGAREAYQAATAQGQMGQESGQQAAITYMPSGAGGGN